MHNRMVGFEELTQLESRANEVVDDITEQLNSYYREIARDSFQVRELKEEASRALLNASSKLHHTNEIQDFMGLHFEGAA